MNSNVFKKVFIAFLLLVSSLPMYSQKVGVFASDIIREKFSESKQADQRIRSMVEEWRRELDMLEKQIQDLDFEIKKNRLVWSDEEKRVKEKTLEDMKIQKTTYARKKFEQNGEYDMTVKAIMQPVEEKIFAAVNEVAIDEGYDIIWDKSIQPLPYINLKYDLTIKILKKLGVNTEELEKEFKDKVAKDPRNQEKKSKDQPRKRSRDRSTDVKKDKNATPDADEIIPENPIKPGVDSTGVKPFK